MMKKADMSKKQIGRLERERESERGKATGAEGAAPMGTPRLEEDANSLTSRELEVLELLAGGLTNNQIARALFITPYTAKAHVTRILYKLGVDSRTEAALLWARRGNR